MDTGALASLLAPLAPQLVLAGGALAAIVVSLFTAPRPGEWKAFTVLTLLAALVVAARQWDTAATLVAGTTLGTLAAPLVSPDALGAAWQLLLYAGALPLALLARPDDEVPVVLLLGSVCGMGLLAVAGNLLMLFVALELASLPAYLLVWKWSRGERGNEAAVKYFFVGAAAGALFLMGMALRYAAAGEGLALPGSRALLGEVAVALMGAAALFKIGAVPLHFWIPDVYEASRPELAGFFSSAMKAAALLLLLRVAGLEPGSAFAAWLPAIGAVTTLVGALLAWRQRDLQRLLAYSSISHAGVLVLGAGVWALDGGSPAAARALFFYLAAYLFMSNGAFAFLATSGLVRREELAGYAAARPAPAAALAAILLSLGGIPP
ncbi:MAG: NADH-quinone oxidoreductase subunit N, partial [Thermoanaerobaculia bacterium]